MTTGTDPLPDPKTLNGDQLRGWSCALCRTRLFRDRFIGRTRHPYDNEVIELWACAPSCPPKPPRRR